MADVRSYVLSVTVVSLLLNLISAASAQPTSGLVCQTTVGTPLQLRSEGFTELVGDILINCTGGTPVGAGMTIPLTNITLTLNTQVTSQPLGSGNLSEALLLIDEPTPSQTSAAQTCTSNSGCIAIGLGPGSLNSLEF